MKKIQFAVLFLVLSFFVSVSHAHASGSETVLVRNGASVIYQGTVALPSAGTVSIVDDSSGHAVHSVNADSVMGLLYSIGQSSGNFALTGVHDYGSMGMYLNCVTPTGNAELCANWQYVVNGTSPWTSMDTTMLSGGETVVLYFGTAHEVTFNRTTIKAGGSVMATAHQYNYMDNTWSGLTGVSVAATVPSSDPYNPTVITSVPVDGGGNATIVLSDLGTYNVGIAEDYYYPYTITVSKSGRSPHVSTPVVVVTPTFSLAKAVSYLTSTQDADGGFGGSPMYTDWAAIALSAAKTSTTAGVSDAVMTKLLSYMTTHNTVSENLTDNERHTVALLSLGQNPYSANGTDFVAPIVKSFDGTQFGDPSLVNDDIFALISLSGAGYTSTDPIVSKDVAFIISKQTPDGSWNSSVDITASAVQALKIFSSVDGVSLSIERATKYLQNTQLDGGSFGNVSTTSWVAQTMSALGVTWTMNGKTVVDFFNTQQSDDGAMLSSSETLPNRIWTTSYAIPAALGMPWNAIMHTVAKPVVVTPVENPTVSNIAAVSSSVTLPVVQKIIVRHETLSAPKPTPTLTTPVVVETTPVKTGFWSGVSHFFGKMFSWIK